MNIFLRQEIDRMQKVLIEVRTTLCDLKLAIDGTIVMSQSLRYALDAMYDARIPERWLKVGSTDARPPAPFPSTFGVPGPIPCSGLSSL